MNILHCIFLLTIIVLIVSGFCLLFFTKSNYTGFGNGMTNYKCTPKGCIQSEGGEFYDENSEENTYYLPGSIKLIGNKEKKRLLLAYFSQFNLDEESEEEMRNEWFVECMEKVIKMKGINTINQEIVPKPREHK